MIFQETKRILKENDAFAKKHLGQNFLINLHTFELIMKYSEVSEDVDVIEIGPGIGSLTEFLALKARRVIVYEIDPSMIQILQKTLSAFDNITIRHMDFLQANIQEDIEQYFPNTQKVVVVANVPYYITTPILFKLLEETDIKHFCFMVQKEVGERLTGTPNTKDYNALSVLMKYKSNSKIVGTVSKKSFFPEPQVDSVLLRVETIKNDYNVNFEAKFIDFIQAIFRQRRKTIVNNIVTKYGLEKEDIIKAVEYCQFNANVRAEALSIEDIVKLYKYLFESPNKS